MMDTTSYTFATNESLSPHTVTISAPEPASCDRLLKTSKIMIVDDESVNLKVAEKYLQLAGYEHFVTTTESRDAVELVAAEHPDLVLLDVMMPHVSGLEILASLRADERWKALPIIILTASTDQETRHRALRLGANDFLAKPIDPSELVPRIRNVLTVKEHYDHLQKYSQQLEAEVLWRTAELAQSRQEVIHCLARACEFRDDNTGRHVLRVGRYSRLIAEQLGWIGESLDALENAAQLHDVGKIGIPDHILRKPGKLTPEEFEFVQKHTSFGKRITEVLPDHEANVLREHAALGARILDKTHSPVLELAADIALSHHEKWDGSGYPLHLAGENIPLVGRITAVADVFDALASKRPYKEPFPLDECFAILEEGRGQHFDPEVLDAFIKRRQEIVATLIRYADTN